MKTRLVAAAVLMLSITGVVSAQQLAPTTTKSYIVFAFDYPKPNPDGTPANIAFKGSYGIGPNETFVKIDAHVTETTQKMLTEFPTVAANGGWNQTVPAVPGNYDCDGVMVTLDGNAKAQGYVTGTYNVTVLGLVALRNSPGKR